VITKKSISKVLLFDLQNARVVADASAIPTCLRVQKNADNGGCQEEETLTSRRGEKCVGPPLPALLIIQQRVVEHPEEYACIGCDLKITDHETLFETRRQRVQRGTLLFLLLLVSHHMKAHRSTLPISLLPRLRSSKRWF
jgi:hypothetical protein